MINKIIIIIVVIMLIGCAYVHDSRLYSVNPQTPQEETQKIAQIIEKTLTQKGLILKSKYHDTYPKDVNVSVLEIPRKPEEKRRDPLVIMRIKDHDQLQLEHSEWWLTGTGKSRPNDYINELTSDLKVAVKKALGIDIEFVLTKKDLY